MQRGSLSSSLRGCGNGGEESLPGRNDVYITDLRTRRSSTGRKTRERTSKGEEEFAQRSSSI